MTTLPANPTPEQIEWMRLAEWYRANPYDDHIAIFVATFVIVGVTLILRNALHHVFRRQCLADHFAEGLSL